MNVLFFLTHTLFAYDFRDKYRERERKQNSHKAFLPFRGNNSARSYKNPKENTKFKEVKIFYFLPTRQNSKTPIYHFLLLLLLLLSCFDFYCFSLSSCSSVSCNFGFSEMSHVLVQRERQGRNIMILCFFLFFVFFQISLCSSSASVDSRGYFVSPPRKALAYGTVPFRGSLSREDDIYGDDKRVVHTGPNPLHN